MSDGDERADGVALAAGYAQELWGVSPKHELLKYIVCGPGEELDEAGERALQEELIDRFWDKEGDWRQQSGSRVQAYIYGRYAAELREMIVAEREAKKTALDALAERVATNADIVRKNNAQLHAGSPMYYYCRACNAELVLLEVHDCPAPTHCDDCKELLKKGWIEMEIKLPSR